MKKGRGPEGKELRSKPSFLSTCALRADALLDSPIGRISLFVPYLGPPKVSVLSAFFVLTPRHQELVYCKNTTLSTS
jgi:hypothetical protein